MHQAVDYVYIYVTLGKVQIFNLHPFNNTYQRSQAWFLEIFNLTGFFLERFSSRLFIIKWQIISYLLCRQEGIKFNQEMLRLYDLIEQEFRQILGKPSGNGIEFTRKYSGQIIS